MSDLEQRNKQTESELELLLRYGYVHAVDYVSIEDFHAQLSSAALRMQRAIERRLRVGDEEDEDDLTDVEVKVRSFHTTDVAYLEKSRLNNNPEITALLHRELKQVRVVPFGRR